MPQIHTPLMCVHDDLSKLSITSKLLDQVKRSMDASNFSQQARSSIRILRRGMSVQAISLSLCFSALRTVHAGRHRRLRMYFIRAVHPLLSVLYRRHKQCAGVQKCRRSGGHGIEVSTQRCGASTAKVTRLSGGSQKWPLIDDRNEARGRVTICWKRLAGGGACCKPGRAGRRAARYRRGASIGHGNLLRARPGPLRLRA
jgi:hypothetical protein